MLEVLFLIDCLLILVEFPMPKTMRIIEKHKDLGGFSTFGKFKHEHCFWFDLNLNLALFSHPKFIEIRKKKTSKFRDRFLPISVSNLGRFSLPRCRQNPPRGAQEVLKIRGKIMDFGRSKLNPLLGVVLDGFSSILVLIFKRFGNGFSLILGGLWDTERNKKNED